MSNLLSGILAIIIALTSMCGGLANSNVEKAMIIDAGITFDGDATTLLSGFMQTGGEDQTEQINATIDGIKELLKAITLRFQADKTVGQMAVLINGEPASSLTVKANDAGDGWNVISTLFPSSMLTVTQATIDQMQNSFMKTGSQSSSSLDLDELKQLDVQALTQLASEAFSEVAAGFTGSAGEPETGSWEIDGVVYTTKVPYNITTKEAGLLILNAVKKVMSEETLSALLTKINPSFSVASLDEAIQQLQDGDESTMQPLAIAAYTNEDGNNCMEITLGTEEEGLDFILAQAATITKVSLKGLGLDSAITVDNENKTVNFNVTIASGDKTVVVSGTLAAVSDSEFSIAFSVTTAEDNMPKSAISANLSLAMSEGRFDVNGNLSFNYIPVTIKGFVTTAEDRTDLELALSIPMSADAPPTLTIKGSMTYGDAPAFDADGLNVVPFEAQESGEILGAEIQESISSLLENLKNQFPIIEALMSSMGGSTEGPVVVEEDVPVEDGVPVE